MSNTKETESQAAFEVKAQGTLTEKGVKISEKGSIDAFTQRGYGTVEENTLTLAFYEALYLMDRKVLTVKGKRNTDVNFRELLHTYEAADENAWMHYLVYRDLRSRGYVVREGIGAAIDFRIYERGSYGKEAASFLVLGTQEGQPMPMEDLSNALAQTGSLKKELILAVMNRRGEIVYYSVSPLTFK